MACLESSDKRLNQQVPGFNYGWAEAKLRHSLHGRSAFRQGTSGVRGPSACCISFVCKWVRLVTAKYMLGSRCTATCGPDISKVHETQLSFCQMSWCMGTTGMVQSFFLGCKMQMCVVRGLTPCLRHHECQLALASTSGHAAAQAAKLWTFKDAMWQVIDF